MSNLIPFTYAAHDVRVHLTPTGEAWWVAKDVCDVLGIADHRQAYERLDADEKGWCLIPTPGGDQRTMCVNESGLYNLILRSRKPEAKAFKRWITHEVLPTIRKTGKYEAPTVLPATTTGDMLVQMAEAYRAQEQRLVALEAAQVETLARQVESLERSNRALQESNQALQAMQQLMDAQAWLTIHQYVISRKLTRQLPPRLQQEYGRYLTGYCVEHGYKTYPVPVAHEAWKDEKSYWVGAINETLPGWLARHHSQTELTVLPGGAHA